MVHRTRTNLLGDSALRKASPRIGNTIDEGRERW